MIGICTTLVGLVKILEGEGAESRVDEIGGIIALFFVTSAVLSYVSLRMAARSTRLSVRVERVADAAFILGLLGVAGLTLRFAYERF